MADMMTFPNTVEEFMEQYKIVDTEEIYTNGAELVPIFRMMQWFEHEPERKMGGKWMLYDDGFFEYVRCDQCLHIQEDKSNFCPNCGADMRGDENGKNE